jgi:threonine dehydrogenase-like Zn-dependent dehydrogenase
LKAAQIVAPRRLEWIETPRPSLDDLAGESVLVHFEAGVLCASDFPRFLGGAFNVEFPRPVGDSLHEIIGQVVESRSPRFQPGDSVLSIPPDQRGLSEYFLADASMTVPLPEFQHRERLILAQPLGTIIWAARKLSNLIDRDVVVIGQGPIGLLWDHLLANMGARRVIGLDRIGYRLDAAKKMHATHTLDVDRDDVQQAVLDLTDGEGADVVIEAVGHQHETIDTAVRLAKSHGTVLLFGVPDEEVYPMPIWAIFRKNLKVIGSVHPNVQRDLPLALDMIRDGRVDVAPLITHRYKLSDAAEAFDLAISKRDQPIKVLLARDDVP